MRRPAAAAALSRCGALGWQPGLLRAAQRGPRGPRPRLPQPPALTRTALSTCSPEQPRAYATPVALSRCAGEKEPCCCAELTQARSLLLRQSRTQRERALSAQPGAATAAATGLSSCHRHRGGSRVLPSRLTPLRGILPGK